MHAAAAAPAPAVRTRPVLADDDAAVEDSVRLLLDENEPKQTLHLNFGPGVDVAIVCARDGNPGALQSGIWLWPAAKALSFYLAARGLDERWHDCLELGAGAALAGVVVARLLALRASAHELSSPSRRLPSVLLTDRDFVSLRMIKRSLAENAAQLAGVAVKTRRLVFIEGNQPKAGQKEPFVVDFVLGTDLIYSDRVAQSLVQTLAHRLSRERPWVFMLCSSFRHEDTTLVVDEECRKLGIKRRVLEHAFMDCLIEEFVPG
jgi:predicted nicotinamide N-methyase